MQLDESLIADDVSRAWLVWSGAAEVALADAFRFSGGHVPARGLVLGCGSALFHVVRLGGPMVKRVRCNIADAVDAADVFLFRDSSIAPLFDMERRFQVVLDVLGAMVRYGVSLARSVELTAQWNRILAAGSLCPVTFGDLHAVEGLGIGDFHRVVSDVHHRLSDFIREVVVHRRDEAIKVWRNWLREDPMVHPYKRLRPDLVLPAPFLQCKAHLTPGGSGVLADRLQFMSRDDVVALDESLDAGDVSCAWLVWSSAVEAALADAFRFSGPVPDRGLVLGRSAVRMRTVRLGGPLKRPVRRNAADAREGEDVHLKSDSSAALLDLRRWLESFMDVLNGRSVELLVHWDRVLQEWPLGPATQGDLLAARECGLGESRRLVGDLYCRLSDFIHWVVVHRRDVAITAWRSWLQEDPLVHPEKWLRPDVVPPAPFLQCQAHLTPGGPGVLADPARIDEEFPQAWPPYFCRSGQRETSLEEFSDEVDGCLPLLSEVCLPDLTGEMLADVVRREGVTAGGLDGWGWRELKVLPVAWNDGLVRILTKVEEIGASPDGLLDA